MGICETKNITNEQNSIKEENIENKTIKLNESIKINKSTDRIQECIIEKSHFEKLDAKLTNVSKSVCKIKIETKE